MSTVTLRFATIAPDGSEWARLQRGFARICQFNLIALGFQVEAQSLGNMLFIFDNKKPFHT